VQPFQRPKVDAHLWKDSRSRSYGVSGRGIVGDWKKTLWLPPRLSSLPLNQQNEGACVGFGWSAELQVPPVEIPVHNQFARNLYMGARDIDRREGRFYQEGATVLAGAKYCRSRGWISEFLWHFTLGELKDSLCYRGPVVWGIPWYDGMYQTDQNGRIRVNGALAGGHCILNIGYWPAHPLFGNCFVLLNSWGNTWGINGIGYLPEPEAEQLLIREQGEMCIASDIVPQPKVPWWRRVMKTFQ